MIQKKYSILVTNCFYSKINRTAVILHNEAFVTRTGMIDHLAGMHRMPRIDLSRRCGQLYFSVLLSFS
jgi:hypothetical protein